MQPQINAIKQLLEANNAIASQIDKTIVKWLGDSASWENASTYQSIAAFDSGHGSLPDGFYGSSPKNSQTLELLWRSRIDLNDARINAEEVDLSRFLTDYDLLCQLKTQITNNSALNLVLERDREIENLKLALDAAKKPTDDLQMECDQLRRDLRERDRVITHTETEIDSLRLDVREKSQDISLLKTTIKGFEAVLDLANEKASKAIAPNLDAFQSAVDEAVNSALLEKIAERDREIERLKAELEFTQFQVRNRDNTSDKLRDIIEHNKNAFAKELRAALDLIAERDREINWLESALTFLGRVTDDTGLIVSGNDCTELELDLARKENRVFVDSSRNAREYVFMEPKKDDRDRQIQELQITNKNNREQFDNLKAHFEVLLKAIAMNLNALKGERKPDEIREVNGVMTTFRNYDDNLTHHHKTIIIENLQRAIAEEAKKLKGVNPKDFSFDDDIPF